MSHLRSALKRDRQGLGNKTHAAAFAAWGRERSDVMSLLVATTVATLLIASPSVTDADRIAANGGFLVGNAHRCGLAPERVERAGELVHELITAASADEQAQSEATMRFVKFFLVSALAGPGKEKLVASCKAVSAELGRLERHRVALTGANAEAANRSPRLRPGDGE
jgi:hypothetical protein